MASLDSLLSSATANVSSAALGIDNMLGFISPPVPASTAKGYTAVYAFGDSLSDAGNIAYSTRGAVPASPPYSDGRFSNGPVWIQDLSQDLGLPPVKASLAGGTDFAYGGAETGPTPVHAVNPTDLPGQVAQFAVDDPIRQPDALYAVWIGSNDVLDIANHITDPVQQQADVATAVQNEVSAISSLVALGAKDLLVLNVPNIGESPYEVERGPVISATASSLSGLYNQELASSLQGLMASGAAKVDLLDTYSLLDEAIANPGPYGFTNVTSPVWNGDLTSPSSGTMAATGTAQSKYLFFDDLHPTAQTHALLASAAFQSLPMA
ncbi:MAG: SGNH/GDSL hydrolase family protein [Acetobacteraceae bacterium]|nr:SGNH/GDSL hydrolase family protein [Acetobacteraceae bacterium]